MGRGIAGVEKRGEDRRERERGKRRCRECLGRSFRAKSTRASYTIRSTPARSADTSIHLWQTGSPPILHSSPSQLAQIEISLLFPLSPPLTIHSSFPLSFSLSHLQCLRMGLCKPRTLFSISSFPLLSLAFPFCSMNPSCMRLFPHVVLIIYSFFHFSAPFFSALPISQAGEVFIYPPYPLICAAMHRHFPECFTYPLSLQSLTPLKQAWALGLPGSS